MAPVTQFEWRLLILSTVLKVFLAPSYKSTDFEVHRNWLAITHSLPLSQWYYEATSEWTLDYPPFFAYFEWLLARATPYVDPKIISVSGLNYDSVRCIAYQRLTVILSELVLFYALHRYLSHVQMGSRARRKVIFASILLNAGLIFVDHIHFQYNGFLYGILLLSIVDLLTGHAKRGAAIFAALLYFKHIYLYIALPFFIYLLRGYVLQRDPQLLGLGSIVILITALSMGPFVWYGQVPQVLSRLFPFKRGLVHAYWAPNAWALYLALDRFLLALARFLPVPYSITPLHAGTRGLVGDTAFSVLPEIIPLTTFLLTLLFQIPALLILWRKPCRETFLGSIIISAYASFLFGWHVHEKAILLILIPFSLDADRSYTHFRSFVALSIAGQYALFPLLFQPAEWITRTLILLLWICLAIPAYHSLLPADRSLPEFLPRLDKSYYLLLAFIEIYGTLVHPILFPSRLPFLPLMLISISCSLGVLVSCLSYYACFLKLIR
ncbi:MAG: dolichyl glycosyltransferase [Piptocephalis tieghemiana]|nr:MAG: dolichyl glycosyltransferase [Piptocephalis tieghemiana]